MFLTCFITTDFSFFNCAFVTVVICFLNTIILKIFLKLPFFNLFLDFCFLFNLSCFEYFISFLSEFSHTENWLAKEIILTHFILLGPYLSFFKCFCVIKSINFLFCLFHLFDQSSCKFEDIQSFYRRFMDNTVRPVRSLTTLTFTTVCTTRITKTDRILTRVFRQS